MAQPNTGNHGLRAALLLVTCLLVSNALAEPLRVTTWNLQSDGVTSASGTNQVSLALAAATLKELNPDVILLQQVRDWQTCGQLAKALKPESYNVVVCSSFRDEPGRAGRNQQVAILARHKAYFSWSEPWRAQNGVAGSGGFVFAAIQIGDQRVGVFSAQLDHPSAPSTGAAPQGVIAQVQAAATGQLLEQVGSVANWVANRVHSFVIAGSLENLHQDLPGARTSALQLLEHAEFFDACRDVPASQRNTLAPGVGSMARTTDYIFAQMPALVSNPTIMPTSFSDHYPVTCELELDPVGLATAPVVRAEPPPAPASSPAPQTMRAGVPGSPAQPEPATVMPKSGLWFAAVLGALLFLSLLVWLMLRTKFRAATPAPALLPLRVEDGGAIPPSYTVLVAPRSVTGSADDPAPEFERRPLVHIEAPGTTQTQSAAWQRRALAAEQQARQATAIVHHGLIPHLREWLKQHLVRRLMADRTKMLEAQAAATVQALAVEERLGQIELQIRQQNQIYERRIEELSRELAAAKEENRDLIRVKITQVKAEMDAARARILAQTRMPGA